MAMRTPAGVAGPAPDAGRDPYQGRRASARARHNRSVVACLTPVGAALAVAAGFWSGPGRWYAAAAAAVILLIAAGNLAAMAYHVGFTAGWRAQGPRPRDRGGAKTERATLGLSTPRPGARGRGTPT